MLSEYSISGSVLDLVYVNLRFDKWTDMCLVQESFSVDHCLCFCSCLVFSGEGGREYDNSHSVNCIVMVYNFTILTQITDKEFCCCSLCVFLCLFVL